MTPKSLPKKTILLADHNSKIPSMQEDQALEIIETKSC